MVRTIVALAVVMGIVTTACGGSPQPGAQGRESGQIDRSVERGRTVFADTCASCHGPGAEGVPGLGKDLTESDFIAGRSDQGLLAFIRSGRAADDPDNTTGVAMPPSGGNPSLTEEDILDVVAYLRSLTG